MKFQYRHRKGKEKGTADLRLGRGYIAGFSIVLTPIIDLVAGSVSATLGTAEIKGVKMFIAMNRFRIALGHEDEFEALWTGRDSHLKGHPGFLEFHLLKGPGKDDHTLYSSHTVWTTRGAFDDWVKSEAFRAAHKAAGERGHLYLGPPQFEGFDVVQHIK